MIKFIPLRSSVLIWIAVVWNLLSPATHAQIGGLDTNFAPAAILNGAAPGSIRALVVQSDNKVIVAGDFTSIGGVARGRIARLNSDGSLDPSFATGAGGDAPINALSVQTDGNIVIGGDFTTVDTIGRNRIARLTTNGLLDTTFNPGTGANGTVNAVRIIGSSIYVAGDFTQVNGSNRGRLARLSSAGLPDTFMSFSSGPNATVYALASNSSGLVVGGAFTTFNGASRNRLAVVNTSSGTLDPTFNSSGGPDGTVYAMRLNTGSSNSTSELFIGGDFLNVGSAARSHIAVLSVSTLVQWSYTLSPGFTIPADGRVLSFGVADGKMLVGGEFTQISAQPRNHIARIIFRSSGSSVPLYDLDTTFPAGASAAVRAIQATADEKPVLGGDFSSISGMPTQSVARLYSDAGSQPPATPTGLTATALSATQIFLSFNSSVNATSSKIERSADGIGGWTQVALQSQTTFTDSLLTAGTQYFYRVTARNSNGDSAPSASVSATTATAEWSAAGALDPAAAVGAGVDGTVKTAIVQPDGATLIAGSFTHVHGLARNNVARLLPDWTVDPAFDPGVGPDGTVNDMVLQPDGKIVIVGSFSKVAGIDRKYVARLHADASVDLTFANSGSGPDSFLNFVGLQPDGRVIVTGQFSEFNGEEHRYMARLYADGTFDATFRGAPGSSPSALSVQRDGRILLGGFFFRGVDVNGLPSKYVARLTADGDVDFSFHPGEIGAFVNCVVALNSGKILVGGSFTSVAGTTRNRVFRLNSDGSLDATFDPGVGPDNAVNHIAPQADGRVLIVGSFNKVSGMPRPHIARLNADGTLDATFQPSAGTFGTINAIAVARDTRIVIGGDFTSFGNGTPVRIARLLGDGVSTPPPVPDGLVASSVSASTLLVSWNDLPAEQGWKLERSPDGLSNWTQVAAPPWDVTALADTALAPGITYFYRLRSSNAAGDSDYSAVASGRTYTLYQQWKIDRGFPPLTGDEGDGDGDGIPLIIEYGLGLDPSVASTEGMPVYQIIGNVLALSYRKFHSDVNYSVEASTDMTVWSTGGVNQGSGAFPIAWKAINGAPQLFLRLRVAVPSQ
jgi:uncharacterized delta-60 repeat protein